MSCRGLRSIGSTAAAADGGEVFLGFHTYDADAGQYVNWGAASSLYEGWGHGTISDDERTVSLSGRAFDPHDPDGTTIEWRGEWTRESARRTVFRTYARTTEGEEFPFKEAVYTRR